MINTITYLNGQDCCSSIENLEIITTRTHIKGVYLMQCRKCNHADYYPEKLLEKVSSKESEALEVDVMHSMVQEGDF